MATEEMNSQDMNTNDQVIRDKAISLFTYLYELAGLRTRMIRSVDQFEELIWLADLADLPGCYCVAVSPHSEGEEVEKVADIWIELQKPKLTPPPDLPEELQDWLDPDQVEDPFNERPTLIEPEPIELDGISSETELRESPDMSGFGGAAAKEEPARVIVDLLASYTESQWLPWAHKERPRHRAQKIYESLFSIHQKQQRLGELYEVIVGFGLLSWQVSDGERVRRHLLVAQTSIDFDLTRGVITVAPGAEGANAALEQDMLEPNRRPNLTVQKQIEQQTSGLANDLWHGASVRNLLKAYANALSADAQYEDSLVPESRISTEALVEFAPALILRKRSERTFQRAFKKIREQLEEGGDIPSGVELILQLEDESATPALDIDHEDRLSAGWTEAPEVLFPLPANYEQLEIVNRLSGQRGVVVQGPPGTGKSHTIANIMCHLLASGKRVLVTSQTSRALQVLREKIPTEVASLCVSLLGNDRESIQALEDSVNGITGRHSTWRPRKNQEKIAAAWKSLDIARRDEAEILSELRAIREREIFRNPRMFGDYEGTAKEIALLVRKREPNHSWVGVRPDPDVAPPLTNAEATQLLALARAINPDVGAELTKPFVDPESLIAPQRFSELIGKERTLKRAFTKLTDARKAPGYRSLLSLTETQRDSLAKDLSSLRANYRTVVSHVMPWTERAAREILSGQGRQWSVILAKSNEYLEAAVALGEQVESLKVAGIDDIDRSVIKLDAELLLSYIRQGGKLRRFLFTPKIVRQRKYLVEDVCINGRPAGTEQALQALIAYLSLADLLENLSRVWGELAPSADRASERQIAEFQDLRNALQEALALQVLADSIYAKLREARDLLEPSLHEMNQVEALEQSARAASVEVMLKDILSIIKDEIANVKDIAQESNAHSSVVIIHEALVNRNRQDYIDAYGQLADLRQMRERLGARDLLFTYLRSEMPDVADELLGNPNDPIWGDRFGRLEDAWNWAKSDRWLSEISDPSAESDLARRLNDSRERQSAEILKIAEAEAWKHCLETLKDSERQHLVAWTKAIRRIGKGTGKYAPEHRRAAQEHMEECRGAIPAWIMPLYRVAESVQPGKDSYDVIIVDEASQSGPEALLLHYLAPKIIVVGDDRQISPDSVGLNRASVNELRRKHLGGIPHNDALGVDNSFFDLAEIRFGGRIRLREHFRCVPEIIQFSNNLAYQADPLIPLRQFGSDRLIPSIKTAKIESGYQRGRAGRIENPPEAEALAASIKECCEDPTFDGKSMGVISLLGEQQARLIERLLLKLVGPDEMERRGLVCGDAYAFQGDERDVMFLSMVSAPGEGVIIRALTMDRDLRRFNVAASRAKDQMWLFHSVTLNDLSPQGLRYKLLEYCLNPSVEPVPFGDIDIDVLRKRSRIANRQLEDAPEPFDSWFEVDVYLKIVERGFRVIPQYEVMGRRIDLVVEGMSGRMAVECDGDTWHGAEQYESDMARQRQLERSGWIFWRVRASEYYRDSDVALETLWETLDDRRIKPNARPANATSTQPENERHDIEPQVPATEDSIGTETDVPVTPTESPSSTAIVNSTSQLPLTSDDDKPITPHQLPIPLRVDEPEFNPVRSIDEVGSIAPGATSDTALQRHKLLLPYQAWTPRTLNDPREAARKDVKEGLIEIVEVEGPVIASRAYKSYATAAGIQKVGRQIRKLFNKALYSAIRDGLIVEVQEDTNTRVDLRVLRIAGTSTERLRERGDRTFHEIPYSEIGKLMMTLRIKSPTISEEDLFRAVLDQYEISRMTSKIRIRLEIAYRQFANSP